MNLERILVEMLPEVRIFAKKLARKGLDYDDCYSTISMKLWEAINRAELREDYRGFCISVMHREMMKAYRDSRTIKRSIVSYATEADEGTIGGYEEHVDILLVGKAAALVNELPKREAAILRYHYLEDHDMKDVAAMCGVTATAMTDGHNRLKAKLREEFA